MFLHVTQFPMGMKHARVAHKLDDILSFAYTYGNISLNIFHLCCASIGLDTSEYGRQLVGKLKMKLKARELFNSCQNVFNTLNCLKSLGHSIPGRVIPCPI